MLADAVLVFHLAFIAFVVGGGLLVLRWPRLIWLHVPAVIWGALVEFMSWPCPLTPLENHFRSAAGMAGYEGDFIGRYLLPIIYPEALTPSVQTWLGMFVLVVNAAVYGFIVRRRMRRG